MKVQKNVNIVWQDYKIVIDDLQIKNLRTIQPNSVLTLDNIWNSYNININEAGNYRVYASFVDKNGIIIQTTNGKLENSWEFKVV